MLKYVARLSSMIALFLTLSATAYADWAKAKWGFCGTITNTDGVLTLQTKDAKYLLQPSKDVPAEVLATAKTGLRRCFFGEVSKGTTDIPFLTVYDYSDYEIKTTILDCTASYVNFANSPYEEGFSHDEYPNVDVYDVLETDNKEDLGLHVSIGSNSDILGSKDKITIDASDAEKIKVTAYRTDSDDIVTILVDKKPKPKKLRRAGVMLINGDKFLARITCKK